MTYHAVLFLAGLAGSFHCVGMCGGFACALGGDARGGPATALRHLLYNLGRVTTYCFLGALAGGVGQAICTTGGAGSGLDGSLDLAQRGLAVVAGLLMVFMSSRFFGAGGSHRPSSGFAAGFGATTLANGLRGLLATPGAAAPLALGVFNGFLPCPLVYAMVARAASTGGPLPGLLTTLAFGLGTFPAILAMGLLGRLLRPRWRRRGVWLAGGFILVLGLVTLGRGIVPMAAHLGHAWHLA